MPGTFEIDTEVRGLKELQAENERIVADLSGPPMVQAVKDATLYVTRDAKIAAPVDTSRLRASITPEIRPHGTNVLGVVGSNVLYAPFMELGTRPHWPPPGALAVWARRHGVAEFVIRRAIGRHGLKPRRYLQGAFEKNEKRIIARIERGVTGIIDK